MMAPVLHVDPAWARQMLTAAVFRITEAMWRTDGTLVVYFYSAVPVSDWVLAELPRCMRISGEAIEAQFVEQVPFITGTETAFVVYKTAVCPSVPLLLKENDCGGETPDAIISFEIS